MVKQVLVKLKESLYFILGALLVSTLLFGCATKTQSIDPERIQFVNKMAGYINEYHQIKGYYPLASGKYPLPAVIYLNSNQTRVNYPVRYNNVTVLDYDVLTNELAKVLGNKFKTENDPIEGYDNPEIFIAKYYAAGNTYLITANLDGSHPLAGHKRFSLPENHKIHNKSKIKDFKFFPAFIYRYTIGSISNIDQHKFSLNDYLKLKKNNFKFPQVNEDIYSAINDRNYSAVKALIKKGVDVNPIHKGFNHISSPLIFAVRNNDFKMSKLLVDAGADVNAKGSYEDSVLIYALNQKDINYDLVELLVKAGSDVNAPNFFGNSPFIVACYLGDVKLVKLFMKNGPNVNQDYFYYKDGLFKKGLTPLKAAINKGHIKIIRLLIENNAEKFKGTPGNDTTPLEYAKKLGKKDVISLLKK